MAKGFTVKADVPKKKNTDEFNIAECRQLIRGKTIVFCLPGRGVSYQFRKSFVGLCFDLGAERCRHSDITRLQFDGELRKM